MSANPQSHATASLSPEEKERWVMYCLAQMSLMSQHELEELGRVSRRRLREYAAGAVKKWMPEAPKDSQEKVRKELNNKLGPLPKPLSPAAVGYLLPTSHSCLASPPSVPMELDERDVAPNGLCSPPAAGATSHPVSQEVDGEALTLPPTSDWGLDCDPPVVPPGSSAWSAMNAEATKKWSGIVEGLRECLNHVNVAVEYQDARRKSGTSLQRQSSSSGSVANLVVPQEAAMVDEPAGAHVALQEGGSVEPVPQSASSEAAPPSAAAAEEVVSSAAPKVSLAEWRKQEHEAAGCKNLPQYVSIPSDDSEWHMQWVREKHQAKQLLRAGRRGPVDEARSQMVTFLSVLQASCHMDEMLVRRLVHEVVPSLRFFSMLVEVLDPLEKANFLLARQHDWSSGKQRYWDERDRQVPSPDWRPLLDFPKDYWYFEQPRYSRFACKLVQAMRSSCGSDEQERLISDLADSAHQYCNSKKCNQGR